MKPLVHKTDVRDYGLLHLLLLPVALFILCFQSSRLIYAVSCQGQKNASLELHYIQVGDRMRNEGLSNEKAYALLAKLIAHAPNRLAGSGGAAAAVEFARREMENMGFTTWLEPVTVQHWVRSREEEASLILPNLAEERSLSISSLGWSVGTPEQGLTAPVVEIRSFAELHQAGIHVGGKIVFFNKAMERAQLDIFRSYAEWVSFRMEGASKAAQGGAVAVIIRSGTLRIDEFPHTGMVAYDPNVPKIPAVAIATQDADYLSSILRVKPDARCRLKLGCQELAPLASVNVIGQITGSKRPDEIIILGAHLDSWDLGEGAHDDGAGCVQAIEALRLIRALGLHPKRTIRAVLYMNEEFGATGGRDYAVSERRRKEKHIAAIESDSGGAMPLSLGVAGHPEVLKKLQSWNYLFESLGMKGVEPGEGGSDISPLSAQGTVIMSLISEAHRYFDFHHSACDILANVHPRELELGAIALALAAVILSEEGI